MKKLSLTQKLLQNNQLLFIISVVISLVIWVYMSMGSTNDTTVTINDIPIQIELPQESVDNELHAFFRDNLTASATVTGNRTILGSVSSDSFIATATTNDVDRAGDYNLPVIVTKKSGLNHIQISSFSPQTISVKVDKINEKNFNIISKFKYSTKDDYYASVSYEYDTITISGPSEEIREIDKVCAVTDDFENLDKSVSFDAEIVLYDENNNKLPTTYMTLSANTVKGTVNVSPKKTVPIVPVYKNKPTGFVVSNDMISIDPKEITLSGPEDILNSTVSVSLEDIDLSGYQNKRYNIDNLNVNIPNNCKNISNNSTINIVLDFSSLASKTFIVDNFRVIGLDDGFKAEVTSKNLKVEFIGPADDIKAITSGKIKAVIDAGETNGNTGAFEMPVSFTIDGNNTCWAYGAIQADITVDKQ